MLTYIKNKLSSEEFLTKSLSTLLLQIISVVLGFLISLALAQLLGAKGYGDYTYAFTWVTILSLIAIFGFDKLTIKEFARLSSSEDWSMINALYRWMTKRIFLFSLLITALVLILTFVFDNLFEDPITKTVFQISLLAIPLLALALHRQAALQGIKEIVIGQIPEKLVRPAALLLMIGLLFLIDRTSIDTPVAVLASVFALAVSFVLGQVLFKKKAKKSPVVILQSDQQKLLTTSALSYLAIGGITVLSSRIDLLMLGAMDDTSAVGIYAIPLRFSELLGFVLLSFNTVLAPSISELYHAEKHKELKQLTIQTARMVFMLALPIGLILIFGRHHILSFFGEEFISGSLVLVILCASQLFILSIGSVGYLLMMTGNQRFNLISLGISTSLNMLLNFILIPVYGIAGAACATAISIVVHKLLMLFFVVKKLKFNPTVFGRIG